MIKDNGDGTFSIVASYSFEKPSHEEALKLAVWLENMSKLGWADNFGQELDEISAMIRRLVEELDKQGEPYCWEFCGTTFYDKEECFAWWEQMKKTGEMLSNHPPIPLYTTPQTKPLSDEEIMNIYKTVPTNFINFPKETIDFARAIEERHGIK